MTWFLNAFESGDQTRSRRNAKCYWHVCYAKLMLSLGEQVALQQAKMSRHRSALLIRKVLLYIIKVTTGRVAFSARLVRVSVPLCSVLPWFQVRGIIFCFIPRAPLSCRPSSYCLLLRTNGQVRFLVCDMLRR